MRHLAVIVLVPAALAAGLWSGGSRSGPRGPGAGLAIPSSSGPLYTDPAGFDLGEVWEEPGLARTLVIENREGATIRVIGVTCGCDRVEVTPSRFDLPPGQSQTVRAVIDAGATASGGMTPRPFRAALRVRYTAGSDQEHQQAIGEFRGTVKPAVGTHTVWSVGTYSRACGGVERAFAADTPPGARLVALVERRHPDWKPDAEVTAEAGDAGRYTVTLRSALPPAPGQYTCDVTLRATLADGTALPPKVVRAEAEVVGRDARAEPAEVDFGAVSVGRGVESRVRVASVSGKPVRVERVEIEGTGVEVADAGGGDYQVTGRPGTPGPVKATARFHVRSALGVEQLDVPVTVVGVEAPKP